MCAFSDYIIFLLIFQRLAAITPSLHSGTPGECVVSAMGRCGAESDEIEAAPCKLDWHILFATGRVSSERSDAG